MNARALLKSALEQWRGGHHYEAHEFLEDVAECFEETDPSFDIAIALVHVTAAFHKVINDVGARAAPGKIDGALTVLEEAPPEWLGLDLQTFAAELRQTNAVIRAGGKVESFPIPSEPGSS